MSHEVAQDYLPTVVATQANELDWSTEALGRALADLGDRKLLGLKIPQQWGGTQLSQREFLQFQMMVDSNSNVI